MGKIVERGGEKCVGMGKSEERCGKVNCVWREVKEYVGSI